MVVRAGGPLRGDGLRERVAAREPAGRSARAAALGLPAARLRRRAGTPLPVHLHDPGPHRPARHVAEPLAVSPELPRAGRRAVRRRRRAAGDRRVGGRWTSLGGSQFLDSPGTGNYHTYLCDEVVPWVDARYRTLAAPEHRGIAGKSSGGYGAMVTPMLRPDLFGGLATHAGDALFEMCYLPEFREVGPRAPRRLRGLVRPVLGGLPVASGLLEGERRRPPQQLVHGRLLLGRPRRHRPPPLRPGHRAAHPGRLGALARLGPRAHGSTARRRAAVAPRDLHRRRHARRVLPRPRRRGVPAGARGRRRHRRPLRAVRRDAHGDRVPLPAQPARTWPSGCRPTPRARPGVPRGSD